MQLDFGKALRHALIVLVVATVLAAVVSYYSGLGYKMFASLMPLVATLTLGPAVLQIWRRERWFKRQRQNPATD